MYLFFVNYIEDRKFIMYDFQKKIVDEDYPLKFLFLIKKNNQTLI